MSEIARNIAFHPLLQCDSCQRRYQFRDGQIVEKREGRDLVAEGAAVQRIRLVAVLLGFYWELNGLPEKARFLAEVNVRFRTTT